MGGGFHCLSANPAAHTGCVVPDPFDRSISLGHLQKNDTGWSASWDCGIVSAAVPTAAYLGHSNRIPYLAVALCCQNGKGIGGGDVKLAGSLGLVLGLSGGLFASVIGLTGFVLSGMGFQMYRRYRKKEEQAPLPLGPFLAVGAAVIYFMQVGGMVL